MKLPLHLNRINTFLKVTFIFQTDHHDFSFPRIFLIEPTLESESIDFQNAALDTSWQSFVYTYVTRMTKTDKFPLSPVLLTDAQSEGDAWMEYTGIVRFIVAICSLCFRVSIFFGCVCLAFFFISVLLHLIVTHLQHIYGPNEHVLNISDEECEIWSAIQFFNFSCPTCSCLTHSLNNWLCVMYESI